MVLAAIDECVRNLVCVGTDPARIAVSNGSCEILLAAALALCEPDDEILYAWPSFSMYPHLPALSGAREIRVPLADGYATSYRNFDLMAQKVKPRQQLVVWDPHITPILAEKAGIVRYEDIEEGETARFEEERKGGGGESRSIFGAPNAIRVTVGTSDEHEFLAAALQRLETPAVAS